MTALGDYCRRQKAEGETGLPGATPAGINTHAGPAAVPGDEIAACWRHCSSARGYQSRKGTKEAAGVNGPNLLLLQALITGERPGKQDACPAPQGVEEKLLFSSTEQKSRIYPYADAELF